MRNLITSFARNRVFANVVLTLIFLGGILAAYHLVREMFPEFSTEKFAVTVSYPGADPEEVEEGVVRKIEESLRGLEGIKQVLSYSSENVGSVLIEVRERYDLSQVMRNVRARVDSISTFPFHADKPVFTELVLREPVILLSLSGDMSERRLKEWTEQIRDEIRQMDEVSQVEVFGSRNYEMAVEVSEERLREYGLTLNQVAGIIRNSSLNLGGGAIRAQGEEIRIRTIGRKYTDEEFASIVLLAKPTGEIVTLDRVAAINDGFTDDPVSAAVNGERSLLLGVFKTNREDALLISEAVRGFVSKKQQQTPGGANIKILYDNTEMLRSRINLLVKNGAMGLALVFILLWIFTDRRVSFWVGIGIPVAFAGGLTVLWAFGGSINMISLLGLITISGMIVDDAIVVGEAIYLHRKNGAPPLKAAVDGLCEVGAPVTVTVLTTIVAFLPLAFIGGVMGKFIYVLPVVMIACLLTSLVECIVLFPAHLSTLPQPQAAERRMNPILHPLKAVQRFFNGALDWTVNRLYAPLIARAIRWRYVLVSVMISLSLLILGMVQGGIVKFEMFPEIDSFLITSNIEFPGGTPAEVTGNAVSQLEEGLMRVAARTRTRSGDDLVVDRVAVVGQGMGDVEEIGPNYGAVQVVLLDSERRGIHSNDIIAEWEREVGPIPGARSVVFQALGSGPAGPPIEVWVQGRQMETILSAAEELKTRLREFDGVFQVHSDFRQGKNEIRLALKPEARALGLNVSDLAQQIQAGYYGEEALRLQRGREEVRVKVRYTHDERSQVSDLWNVRIRTQSGHEVPLLSAAQVDFGPGVSTIVRTDGRRRVAVSAEVDPKRANAGEIMEELSRDFFPQIAAKYPDLHVSFQGEQKETRESFNSLFVGYPLALLGIFIIMASTFRSYLQPFVIMFTVPFGIIGAVLGHIPMGYNLSLMSVFGMVALTGVVVNDAIVFIERVNVNLEQGIGFFNAIVEAGVRRFRPIFLTTVTTVGGLAPLMMETDLQGKFLIPIAISISAGLVFATFLTLVLIPALLVILSDLRCICNRMRYGIGANREALEPAIQRNSSPI